MVYSGRLIQKIPTRNIISRHQPPLAAQQQPIVVATATDLGAVCRVPLAMDA